MLGARDAGTMPDQLLVDQGVITPEQRAGAIAERLGLDYLDLTHTGCRWRPPTFSAGRRQAQ